MKVVQPKAPFFREKEVCDPGLLAGLEGLQQQLDLGERKISVLRSPLGLGRLQELDLAPMEVFELGARKGLKGLQEPDLGLIDVFGPGPLARREGSSIAR